MNERDDAERTLVLEAVERREVPRGPMNGLIAVLPALGARPALEVGIKGLFVALGPDELPGYAIGDSLTITVTRGALGFECYVEVIRKETSPRVGMALRIIHIAPSAELIFETMRG